MKKRFKLITSIAALSLAVALMAFGVYAATQSTVNISSSVQYTSNEVDVTWKLTVTGGDYTGTYTTETVINDANTPGSALTKTIPVGAINFTATNTVITYTLTATNNGSESIYITFDAAHAVPATIASLLTVAETGKPTASTGTAIASKAVHTYTLVLTLEDATKSLPAVQNVNIKLSCVKTVTP